MTWEELKEEAKKMSIMKRLFIILCILFISVPSLAETNYGFSCVHLNENIKRCSNDEVVCYLYDSGWAGLMKSGRGAGISCIKKKESK